REARDLPWRLTRDPYKIWLSEVILQQTRIDQGLGYYLRFIERFPTVEALAESETDTLMKYWEGLGYYSRARNLHHTAKVIAQEHGGRFPDDYRELMKLKGIGPYTARAVGSLAFDNVTGVLDGNVFRVLSRYLGDFSPIDLPATRNAFQARLDLWIAEATKSQGDVRLPGKFNQAMMDLGAMVCTPRNPACGTCPLAADCIARARGTVAELPVKAKKLQRKTVWQHFYLVGVDDGNLWVQRRPAQGLWPNLWEIPNLEVAEQVWNQGNEGDFHLLGAFKHVFTHLDMMIKVYAGEALPAGFSDNGGETLKSIPLGSIGEYAFSRAVLKIFERYLRRNAYFPIE
ncbi:MAG TPA: A/G-specific adenine glycosylase, partial [Bacteroidia bacterium]|nr:A/G-specific adenine glycosylase [Bacteroidia bacterium]